MQTGRTVQDIQIPKNPKNPKNPGFNKKSSYTGDLFGALDSWIFCLFAFCGSSGIFLNFWLFC